jgi:hypothetical protein
MDNRGNPRFGGECRKCLYAHLQHAASCQTRPPSKSNAEFGFAEITRIAPTGRNFCMKRPWFWSVESNRSWHGLMAFFYCCSGCALAVRQAMQCVDITCQGERVATVTCTSESGLGFPKSRTLWRGYKMAELLTSLVTDDPETNALWVVRFTSIQFVS